MARAAPPAPSTITGRRPSFQSGRLRFEIGHEAVGVGVARVQSRPVWSSHSVLAAPIARAASSATAASRKAASLCGRVTLAPA